MNHRPGFAAMLPVWTVIALGLSAISPCLATESHRIAAGFDKFILIGHRQGMGPAYESPDVPDSAYPDGMIADRAIAELQRIAGKETRKPFFLAVGFMKPHLPFNAPKKYWDLYQAKVIALAKHRSLPKDTPKVAPSGWNELRGYHGMPAKGPMPDDDARTLIHGYAACVSYTDAMIGRVLDELDKLGLAETTIVVLWGDHGWKLGDLGMWCKHTNFEQDVRVPLIIRSPGMKAAGRHTAALTEFVDLYPSLCELAGLDPPGHLQGTSFAPLLENPDRPWKSAAFSMSPRGKVLGWSMRTAKYRYTEWKDEKTGTVMARELYEYGDGLTETANLAGDLGKAALVEELSRRLQQGPAAARPD